jgi:hypothetical protein
MGQRVSFVKQPTLGNQPFSRHHLVTARHRALAITRASPAAADDVDVGVWAVKNDGLTSELKSRLT